MFPSELEMAHAFKLDHSYEVSNGWRQLDEDKNIIQEAEGDSFMLVVGCPLCNIDYSKGKLILTATLSTATATLLSLI